MRDTAQQRADRIREERRAAGQLGTVRPHATQVVKGRTVTTVTVAVAYLDDLEEVVTVAIEAAGETRTSLFGWTVGPLLDDGSRRVELHTD